MDGSRPGSLSDEAFDRELDAALNVDPSPEFLARVRTRIAAEPVPQARGWWAPSVAWTATAALVVLTVATGIWTVMSSGQSPASPVAATRIETGHTVPPAPSAPVQAQWPAPRVERPGGAAGLQARGRQPQHAPRATSQSVTAIPAAMATAPGEPPFTDVLISEAEVHALRTLVELATVSARRGAESVELPQQDAELTNIAITPVIIEPLPQMARLQL